MNVYDQKSRFFCDNNNFSIENLINKKKNFKNN